jgi:branched-chain amino acid transport system permease protein
MGLSRLVPLARSVWVPGVLAVLLVVSTYGQLALSDTFEPTLIAMLINVVIVIGLYVFAGNSGVISFGHIGFMAIAAYAWAVLSIPISTKHIFLPRLPAPLSNIEVSSIPAAFLASAIAALVAIFLALLIMRLSGIAASISTFAFLVVVQIVIANWYSVTRGRTAMLGMPLDTTVPKTLLWTLIVLFVAYAFQESRVGLRLRASREDEVAARAIGINVYKERIIAFVLSAFIVGSAGPLFGGFVGAFTPNAFYIQLTILTLAMLVVGGVNSLSGAVIGTIVVSLVSEVLRRLEDGAFLGSLRISLPIGSPQVGVGLMMLLILILRPNGITGNREIPFPSQLLDKICNRQAARQGLGGGSDSTEAGSIPEGGGLRRG